MAGVVGASSSDCVCDIKGMSGDVVDERAGDHDVSPQRSRLQRVLLIGRPPSQSSGPANVHIS